MIRIDGENEVPFIPELTLPVGSKKGDDESSKTRRPMRSGHT